jgi:hypothetical protein
MRTWPILTIAAHRVGHCSDSVEGKLLTPLTKKQIKAVERTLKRKVRKRTPLATCKSRKLHRIWTFPLLCDG